MHGLPPTRTRRPRFVRRLLVFGRWIVEREELPRDEEETSIRRTGPSPIGWLASPDPLPSRTDSPPRRRGFLRWLASRDPLPSRLDSPRRRLGFPPWVVSRDQLPSLSDSPHPQRGFPAWLTAREQLPAESPERTPASRSIFRWLLTSEPHDRLENLHSTKEVPLHEP